MPFLPRQQRGGILSQWEVLDTIIIEPIESKRWKKKVDLAAY